MLERGLLWVTRYPFHLYSSEMISETEDWRSNIITKDAPIAIITWKIPRVWGAVSQEPWRKNKYVLLILNHSTTDTQPQMLMKSREREHGCGSRRWGRLSGGHGTGRQIGLEGSVGPKGELTGLLGLSHTVFPTYKNINRKYFKMGKLHTNILISRYSWKIWQPLHSLTRVKSLLPSLEGHFRQ